MIYSVAMEPALKEAIKIAGKKKGKLQGGAKAVIREALIEHFVKGHLKMLVLGPSLYLLFGVLVFFSL